MQQVKVLMGEGQMEVLHYSSTKAGKIEVLADKNEKGISCPLKLVFLRR